MGKTLMLFFGIAFFWSADAMVDDSIQIRIFNPNFSGMSKQELASLIEQADLPSLGYKKITETKIETDFETGLPVHKEAVRFLKKMHCNQVAEAEEMLDKLIPGTLGEEVNAKTKFEIYSRGIETNPTCVTGIEFHLKSCEYLSRTKRGAPGPPGPAGPKGSKDCGVCIGICVSISTGSK